MPISAPAKRPRNSKPRGTHRNRGRTQRAPPEIPQLGHPRGAHSCFSKRNIDQTVATIAGLLAGEGRLYMAAILDVCSKRIVGYAMGKRMTAALPSKALSRAVRDPKPVGTIVHSDRGSQFRSDLFTGLLAVHGLRGSMGRVGAAGDNAGMESFFALLQKNVLNRRRWETRAELEAAIFRWIEIKYHRKWRKKALGRRTPLEFEKWHARQAA